MGCCDALFLFSWAILKVALFFFSLENEKDHWLFYWRRKTFASIFWKKMKMEKEKEQILLLLFLCGQNEEILTIKTSLF